MMFPNLKTSSIQKGNAFNFIRLICCLMVLYEHCVGLSGLSLPNLSLSSYAVHTFFILSGFWVTKSILRTASVKEYMVKRVSRIFPSYWFVVLFWAVVLVFFTSLSAKEYFSSGDFWKYIFWNGVTLNFVHSALPGVFTGQTLNGAVNGALWTIKIEVAFYIVLPVILLILDKVCRNTFSGVEKRGKTPVNCKTGEGGGRCVVLLLIFYALSVIVAGVLSFLVSNYGLSSSLANQIPSLICYFFAGMILLFCYDWFTRHYILVLPAIALLSFHYAGTHTDIASLNVLSAIAAYLEPLALAVLVLFLAMHLKPFNSIGKNKEYSYLIYLWHFPIIRCLVECGVFEIHPVFGIVSTLSAAFFASFIFDKAASTLKNRILLN